VSRTAPRWIAVLLAAAFGCERAGVKESPAQVYLRDPAAVERGHKIFIGTCGAYCHSTHNVERDAPSLFDCEWKHGGTDEEIFKSIDVGIPGTRMPGWGKALPEGADDVWRVVAYLRSASTCPTK
jgi:mono/diheme cytochrome c family protein